MATQLALLNNLPTANPDMKGRLTSAVLALEYMFAGNATFTLRSVKTGTRYTYKVRKAKEPLPGSPWLTTWFVNLLTGPDNGADFAFMGTIKLDDRKTHLHLTVARQWCYSNKSRVSANSPSIGAFTWLYGHLQRGILPESCEVWHEGRCGRCGRKLTVPESVERGIGPECAEKGTM